MKIVDQYHITSETEQSGFNGGLNQDVISLWSEVLPQIHGSTKEPWITTSRRDILFYSNDLRRKLYYQQLQEFNRMRNMYRMRHWSSGSYHLPPITSYNIDYRNLLFPSIQLKTKI
ncbi:hypothetical protein CHS0354_036600 [Potamilus streckersoni]|uniref:Uncharacterized protein n=1 Tax=Potamilus streckersoni TaxID=2493646 RepID=A0AAE0WCA6_9BIVA|nr:hypothetical protein CHS0354_036600 [Potamilus streckersoni]